MTVSVARKNLFSDRTRLAISVGGVAFAILLMLTLLGVYKGSMDQSAAYVNHVDADLWVAQGGSHDMFHTFSLVPVSLAEELLSIEGAAAVHPLVARTTAIDIKGRQNSINVVGYHPESGVGGPWNIVEGRGDPGPGEIVADRVTMKTNDLELGDSIDIEGMPHRIVGVSRGTSVLTFQYAFVDLEETRSFLGPERVNYLLLKVSGPGMVEETRHRILEQYPDLAVFTREEFATNNASLIRDGFLPILAVLVAIAFVVGVAIVGLVVYSATLERYREYGIIKAVGAGNRQLYTVVFEQSLLICLFGFLAGAALSFAVAAVVSELVAQINIAFSWRHFIAAAGATLAMGLLASAIPVRKVNRIDPMIVFRG